MEVWWEPVQVIFLTHSLERQIISEYRTLGVYALLAAHLSASILVNIENRYIIEMRAPNNFSFFSELENQIECAHSLSSDYRIFWYRNLSAFYRRGK